MVAINVAQFVQSLPGTTRDVPFSERLPDPSDELQLRRPVKGHAHLTLTSRGVLVHAEFATLVHAECSRCLTDLQVPVHADFDEEFLVPVDVHTGTPKPSLEEEAAEDDASVIDEHHVIDLDDLIRQAIITNLPLRPLCDAACPGLCPVCGERMEAGHPIHPDEMQEPAAPPVTADSPFAKLAMLLTNDQDGNAAG
jgi:uncharacterized metal-binding protein YceD (DUF177 family)